MRTNSFFRNRGVFGAATKLVFPIVVHLTLPVDNFFADRTKEVAGLKTIIDACAKHKLNSCDTVIMACNTAHLHAETIKSATNIHLRSIVNAAKAEVKSKNIETLGVVASPTSIRAMLFEVEGVALLLPTEEQIQLIEGTIANVINGEDPSRHIEVIAGIANDLLARGASHVVLGCTELELVMRANDDRRLIRPLAITITSVMRSL